MALSRTKQNRASQRVRLTRAWISRQCLGHLSELSWWWLSWDRGGRRWTTFFYWRILLIYKNDENDGRENENCFATFLLSWTYTRMTTTTAMMMMMRATRAEDFNCLAHSACSGWRLTLPLLFFVPFSFSRVSSLMGVNKTINIQLHSTEHNATTTAGIY